MRTIARRSIGDPALDATANAPRSETRSDRVAVGQLVTLRFFGGLTQREAAETLGISSRTADRQWTFARAYLANALRGES